MDQAGIERGECEHGSLRRKCPICERSEEIKELRELLLNITKESTSHGNSGWLPTCPSRKAVYRARIYLGLE